MVMDSLIRMHKVDAMADVMNCTYNVFLILFLVNCAFTAAYLCNDNIPWAINNDLSYGFAAAHISGKSEHDLCCACYELTFTSGPVSGKKMVVQVTNTGDDLDVSVKYLCKKIQLLTQL